MPTKDVSQVVLPGPVDITLDGTNYGYTSEDGVEITYTPSVTEAMVADFGPMPVAAWDGGGTLEAVFQLVQTGDFDVPTLALGSQATKISDSGDDATTVGKVVGAAVTTYEVKFAPVQSANTPTYDFIIYKGYVVGEPKLVYKSDEEARWEIKIRAMVSESRSSGDQLCRFGDLSVTANNTAPTVSSIVPNDAATSVAVDTTIVITFSKAMNTGKLNSTTCTVLESPDGTATTDLEVDYTAAWTTGNTVLTLTPTANLTAATEHFVILNGLWSADGNALAYHATEFDTA